MPLLGHDTKPFVSLLFGDKFPVVLEDDRWRVASFESELVVFTSEETGELLMFDPEDSLQELAEKAMSSRAEANRMLDKPGAV